MAAKSVKVVLTISVLFYGAGPLFIRISHEVVLEDLMELFVSDWKWAPLSGAQAIVSDMKLPWKYVVVRKCLILHDV